MTRGGLEWLGVAWSGSEWLGVASSGLEWLGVEPSKWYLIFLSRLFSGKWFGVGSMNGEFEDLSIDNKL